MTDDPLAAGGRPGRRVSDHRLAGALVSAVGCAVAAGALGLALGGAVAGMWAVAVLVAGAVTMLAGLSHHPHREFGPANAVTLLRLALVAALAGALMQDHGTPGWSLVAVASMALILDGIDGWLARRTGLVSRFGGRFDLEVDCLLALVLSLAVFVSGKVGAWVMLHGLARYLFWGASLLLPWLAGPLPERWSRKAVCVVQIATLIVLVAPPIGAELASTLAAAVLGLVAWSFAADVRALYRSARL